MRLGVLVDNLAASQEAFYLLNYANNAAIIGGHDVIIFYETPAMPCIQAAIGIMHAHEAWGYDAPMVATSLSLAHKLGRLPGSLQKFFYVWDLEWLRLPQKSFMALSVTYNNPAYELIARSTEHARIINDCWNRKPIGVVHNFNIQEMIEIINEHSKAKQGLPST